MNMEDLHRRETRRNDTDVLQPRLRLTYQSEVSDAFASTVDLAADTHTTVEKMKRVGESSRQDGAAGVGLGSDCGRATGRIET